MNMNATTNAPMVQIRPRVRVATATHRNIGEVLDDVRVSHPHWHFLFDECSLLHVPGAAHFETVVELLDTAPSERLRGYVEGLYVNSN